MEEFYWLLQISPHEVTFANFKPMLTGWRALARQRVNALEVPIGALHANCVAFLASSSALSFPRMLQWLGRQAVSIEWVSSSSRNLIILQWNLAPQQFKFGNETTKKNKEYASKSSSAMFNPTYKRPTHSQNESFVFVPAGSR